MSLTEFQRHVTNFTMNAPGMLSRQFLPCVAMGAHKCSRLVEVLSHVEPGLRILTTPSTKFKTDPQAKRAGAPNRPISGYRNRQLAEQGDKAACAAIDVFSLPMNR